MSAERRVESSAENSRGGFLPVLVPQTTATVAVPASPGTGAMAVMGVGIGRVEMGLVERTVGSYEGLCVRHQNADPGIRTRFDEARDITQGYSSVLYRI
jgi:hypothetical protein